MSLSLYVVVYERKNGVASVEGSGLCLSTAAASARECAESLLKNSVWSEAEQAWTSDSGNKVAVRFLGFEWEAIRALR